MGINGDGSSHTIGIVDIGFRTGWVLHVRSRTTQIVSPGLLGALTENNSKRVFVDGLVVTEHVLYLPHGATVAAGTDPRAGGLVVA